MKSESQPQARASLRRCRLRLLQLRLAQLPCGEHLVDDAVVTGLFGGHEPVAVDVLLYLLERLLRVLGDDLRHPLLEGQNLAGLDLDVRRRAAETGRALVD